MLLRLAYLGITNAVALLRLLPRSDRDKDVEILVLRHQLAVLQRHLDGRRVRFRPADRALLAALLHRLPLLTHRHAIRSHPRRRARPRTLRSIRALVLRLASENPDWATEGCTANYPPSG